MAELHITETEVASRMQTSRAALDRLLDPKHEAVTLSTLGKAARVSVVNSAWSLSSSKPHESSKLHR